MKRWLRLATGVLVAIIGVVWTLQGLGYLGGSPMLNFRSLEVSRSRVMEVVFGVSP